MTATVTRRTLAELPIGELIERAGRGDRLLVLTSGQAAAGVLLDVVAGELGDPGSVIRRATGRQCVSFPSGGWIRFHTVRSLLGHGLNLDAIYLDGVVPAIEQLAALAPSLWASGGELVDVVP